jgi:hypothetical protein
MGWLRRLVARVPGFGALDDAGGALRKARDENRHLRGRLARQRERVDIEKRKRARLERRIESLTRGAAQTPALGSDVLESTAAPPLLVFDHLPKTAGTTFRRSYLTAALRRQERWILSGGEENEAERRRFLDMPAVKRGRYRIVAGHHAETLRPHLPQARFLTVVRDPVARTISEYLHAMHQPGAARAWATARQEGLTLGAYVERHGRQDVQSRMLLGDAYDTFDDEALRRHLERRYALAGYTEAFDEFVFLLHVSEGLPLCLYQNRLVRSERASFVPSPEDLDVVRRATAVDARLHRAVRDRFDARLAELTGEAQDKLRRWKTALHDFRQRGDGDVAARRLPDDW